MLGAGAVALSEAQVMGPEFRVNSFTTGDQEYPAVAVDGQGRFVVTWDSAGQDGSGSGVFAQRFDPEGLPAGGEFRVNELTSGDQALSALDTDGAGGFVVAWQSYFPFPSGYEVLGRRYDAVGLPLSAEFPVNSFTTEDQRSASVAVADGGEFVVVWDLDVYDVVQINGVRAQRFDASGAALGAEFEVGPDAWMGWKGNSEVAADSAGRFLVVWDFCTAPIGCLPQVHGRLFDEAGVQVGGELQVSGAADYASAPAVAADGAGNFIVAWTSEYQDGSLAGVYARRYDGEGVPLGGEFRVNSHTTDRQWRPAVAADEAGNFVVAWASRGQDGAGEGIFARWFGPNGQPLGDDFQVNSSTTGDQDQAAIAAGGVGRFVVSWRSAGQDGSGRGVFARQIALVLFADGFEAGDVCAWSATVGGSCL